MGSDTFLLLSVMNLLHYDGREIPGSVGAMVQRLYLTESTKGCIGRWIVPLQILLYLVLNADWIVVQLSLH